MRSDRKTDTTRNGVHRRDFLKTATGGTAAGLAAATLGGGAAPAEAAAPAENGRGRYRESAHVRRAYKLARF
jgi:hypothetical protein